jgi:hypothetical protein
MCQPDRILHILFLRLLFIIGVLLVIYEMIDSNYKHCPTALEWEKATNIYYFLASFYHAICEFSGIKYPTTNLYFPVIFDIYVTLKEEVKSEDEYKRLMTTQMLSKFEKYWSKFSVGWILVTSFNL